MDVMTAANREKEVHIRWAGPASGVDWKVKRWF